MQWQELFIVELVTEHLVFGKKNLDLVTMNENVNPVQNQHSQCRRNCRNCLLEEAEETCENIWVFFRTKLVFVSVC